MAKSAKHITETDRKVEKNKRKAMGEMTEGYIKCHPDRIEDAKAKWFKRPAYQGGIINTKKRG